MVYCILVTAYLAKFPCPNHSEYIVQWKRIIHIAKATCVRFSKHPKEHLMKSPGVYLSLLDRTGLSALGGRGREKESSERKKDIEIKGIKGGRG